MNVFVINGSPKGKHSNTLKLTEAFVEGLGEAQVRQFDIVGKKIGSCKGCFACWNKTPGKCVMQDDMTEVIEGQLWADVIIWSFPLYYFNVPGILKNVIDRQLPMSLPFMVDREDGVGSGSHPARFDMSGKRHVLISTCGFYSADQNYDSVREMFHHICGKDQFEEIFCGQGELFRVPELKDRTDAYLEVVRTAGKEFAAGKIGNNTRAALSELLYPKEVFEQMADASWGIAKDGESSVDESLIFTRQMAALYNKDSFDGKERVVEIAYTDRDKTYQIVLDKDGSKVLEENFLTATTRIETPFDVWQSIARGEIRGDAALMQGMYKVIGDFELMIHWGRYFGSSAEKAQKQEKAVKNSCEKKKPSLVTMLIPWMAFWIATAIDSKNGPIVVLAICAMLPLMSYKKMLTIYDVISLCASGILSALVCFTGKSDAVYVISYFCFGCLWLVSCFSREPLCAAYVKYNYNGDDALNNPIFMRTNYILAAAWGILYIVIATVTCLLYRLDLRMVSMVVNNAAPILMGMFTGWFEGWYPAHVARRGKR